MKYLISLILFSIATVTTYPNFDLEKRKSLFLNLLKEAQFDEGPFKFNYGLETVYVSDKLISLYGELHQYTNLPHGCGNYEGKTYIKQNECFKELTLNDLFPTYQDQELLRTYCENDLKAQEISYFAGQNPLHTYLDAKDLNTFVVDKNFLIIIFQPYVAGSYVDGPFTVKIPHNYIQKHWKAASSLLSVI